MQRIAVAGRPAEESDIFVGEKQLHDSSMNALTSAP
jgi:hypothetical protein